MHKLVFVLEMYAIIFSVAGIGVYFKLKKERKKQKKAGRKES